MGEMGDVSENFKKKINELMMERGLYEEGSPYEIFLGGIIQGIQYAINYPRGGICMRADVEGKSMTEDKKINK